MLRERVETNIINKCFALIAKGGNLSCDVLRRIKLKHQRLPPSHRTVINETSQMERICIRYDVSFSSPSHFAPDE